MKQDYSLLGESGKAAVASGLANPHWFRPKVEPKDIRELKHQTRPAPNYRCIDLAWPAYNLWQPRRVYFPILVGLSILACLRRPLFFSIRRSMA